MNSTEESSSRQIIDEISKSVASFNFDESQNSFCPLYSNSSIFKKRESIEVPIKRAKRPSIFARLSSRKINKISPFEPEEKQSKWKIVKRNLHKIIMMETKK